MRWAMFVVLMLGTWAAATAELGIDLGTRPLSLVVVLAVNVAVPIVMRVPLANRRPNDLIAQVQRNRFPEVPESPPHGLT